MGESNYLRRTLEVSSDSESQVLRIAFASSDQHQVDQHFGSAVRFAIYGVDEEHCELLQIAEFTGDMEGHQQAKIDQRLAVLDGCVAVYCVAVGDSVVRQLWEHGVRPIKVEPGSDVLTLIKEFRSQWYADGSPLRRQYLRQKQAIARREKQNQIDQTMEEE